MCLLIAIIFIIYISSKAEADSEYYRQIARNNNRDVYSDASGRMRWVRNGKALTTEEIMRRWRR